MPETLIGSDAPFTAAQRDCLRAIAAAMIPASDAYDLPGADDAAIFASILAKAGRMQAAVDQALGAIEDAAQARYGTGYVRLDPETRLEILDALRRNAPPPLPPLVSVITAGYYEDDRVLRSLGYEARPPFPEGHVVEQGDWSLLDPVRARTPFYRKIDQSEESGG